jgi:UPF0755 protein
MFFSHFSPQVLTRYGFRSVLVAVLAWYLFCLYIPPGQSTTPIIISLPSGSGIRALARDLKASGLIRSSTHFILLARLRGAAHRLKAGDYSLSATMPPGAILKKIVAGEVDFRKFALPEGYSMYQAAELLEQKGYYKKEAFLIACRNPELLARLGISADSAEGYLYPATYDVSGKSSAEQLVEQMVGQFRKSAHEAATKSKPSGFTQHELVTLASVIEKEAVVTAEKPLISSVFHNRLRIGMPLQSDPTAVYGVRAFSGKVTKADIMRPSPYNTYLNRGLPPGPIGNPGKEAINAAQHPQKTDYFYFVARQDGTHHFSKTLDEHNRAVSRYLK